MKLILKFIKQEIPELTIYLLSIIFLLVYLTLYDIPMQEIFYGILIYSFIFLMIECVRGSLFMKKHRNLEQIKRTITISDDNMPHVTNLIEEDYQKILFELFEDKKRSVTKAETEKQELKEYYTMWVHQIKTPIAAMNLLLQTEEFPIKSELMVETFQIEQYVEMVLQYLRLHSDSTDYILKKCDLDSIIRECVRKYAKLFIRKKVSLSYEPVGRDVITDEKWLSFVIGQVLSNAIKYTESGNVSIYMEENTLIIRDTGIGIRAEDIPRVFEKGFTGFNGHNDKRSTGIGLYLCRRILNELSHSISLESEVGVGTSVRITFGKVEMI